MLNKNCYIPVSGIYRDYSNVKTCIALQPAFVTHTVAIHVFSLIEIKFEN